MCIPSEFFINSMISTFFLNDEDDEDYEMCWVFEHIKN